MNYSNEKILDALTVIRETCDHFHSDFNSCKKCPFSNLDGRCLIIDDTPDYWSINKKSWKALNNK